MTMLLTTAVSDPTPLLRATSRIVSIDAARGLVMFSMIFVNDIAGVSDQIVPGWMRHYPAEKSGMTFVDLVFPAFLFLVGMSIPFAFGHRIGRGERPWTILGHVVLRTASLLVLGVMMVNDAPDSAQMGWSGEAWSALLYLAAILAFASIGPPRRPGLPMSDDRRYSILTATLRVVGIGMLTFLALTCRGADGQRIVTLIPFSIRTEWWGILGLIGWAYLVAAVVFLLFGGRRTAILGCMCLLFCLYPAQHSGLFDGLWLTRYVNIGEALGSQAAIAVGGLLVASMLADRAVVGAGARIRSSLWFVAGCAVGAVLLHGLYGINKNAATPSWCLWACAVTTAIWLALYVLTDVLRVAWAVRPLSAAGTNVLLAYLLHNGFYPVLELLHLGGWYWELAQGSLARAVARSAGCAAAMLALTVVLNRIGFRVRL